VPGSPEDHAGTGLDLQKDYLKLVFNLLYRRVGRMFREQTGPFFQGTGATGLTRVKADESLFFGHNSGNDSFLRLTKAKVEKNPLDYDDSIQGVLV
jgi:hypothetical protein